MQRLTSVMSARPATPHDAVALVAMLDRCSPETRYARFLSPVTAFPSGHLRDAVRTDGTTRWSWVVSETRAGRVVALGSKFRARSPDAWSTGEVALLVEDAQQRRGIETALVELMAARACDVGIETFTAVSLTSSRHVRRMLERVGTVTSRTDGHTSEHVVTVCGELARRDSA